MNYQATIQATIQAHNQSPLERMNQRSKPAPTKSSKKPRKQDFSEQRSSKRGE